MDKQEFAGRKYMVFGASSGIGRACAIRLGELGASVVLVGRNQERLEETAGHIPEDRRVITPCDVSDFDAAEAVVKEAVKRDGVKLDGCVFSVGFTKNLPVRSTVKSVLADMYRTNVFSLYAVLKAFASRRVSRDGGAFVSISSRAAMLPNKGQAMYGGTKGAINSLTIAAAKELAPRQIRVNTICPDMVADTPMGEGGLALLTPEQLQECYPLGLLKTEDVANAVLFLLSDASKKITGQAIKIDAGDPNYDVNFSF